MELKEVYKNVVRKYTNDEKLVDRLWNNIEHIYNRRSRYYHNIKHIESMIYNMNYIKKYIKDIDSMIISIVYHDITYNVLKKDNEEESALFMKSEMSKIDFPNIDKCFKQILATKSHNKTDDSDTNYLIDLDLMMLGLNKDDFDYITSMVRNEYKLFSDKDFYLGRKIFIQNMLNRPSIFVTDYYRDLIERQAVNNLQDEYLTILRKINANN